MNKMQLTRTVLCLVLSAALPQLVEGGEWLSRRLPPRCTPAPIEPAPPNAGYYPVWYNRWCTEEAYLPGIRQTQGPPVTAAPSEELPKRDSDKAPTPPPGETKPVEPIPPLPGIDDKTPPSKPDSNNLVPPGGIKVPEVKPAQPGGIGPSPPGGVSPPTPPGPDLQPPLDGDAAKPLEQPPRQPERQLPKEPVKPEPMPEPMPEPKPMPEPMPMPEPKPADDGLFEAPPRQKEEKKGDEKKGAGVRLRATQVARVPGRWVGVDPSAVGQSPAATQHEQTTVAAGQPSPDKAVLPVSWEQPAQEDMAEVVNPLRNP